MLKSKPPQTSRTCHALIANAVPLRGGTKPQPSLLVLDVTESHRNFLCLLTILHQQTRIHSFEHYLLLLRLTAANQLKQPVGHMWHRGAAAPCKGPGACWEGAVCWFICQQMGPARPTHLCFIHQVEGLCWRKSKHSPASLVISVTDLFRCMYSRSPIATQS
jgi:hypothetical protein